MSERELKQGLSPVDLFISNTGLETQKYIVVQTDRGYISREIRTGGGYDLVLVSESEVGGEGVWLLKSTVDGRLSGVGTGGESELLEIEENRRMVLWPCRLIEAERVLRRSSLVTRRAVKVNMLQLPYEFVLQVGKKNFTGRLSFPYLELGYKPGGVYQTMEWKLINKRNQTVKSKEGRAGIQYL